MKPKVLVFVFIFIVLLFGGGFYFFMNQSQKVSKVPAKAPVEVPAEDVKKEEAKPVEKPVEKVAEAPVVQPLKLNVHLHDFDEDFICANPLDGVQSCENKEKKLNLKISFIRKIPNGEFSISENNNTTIKGRYIHGFINGEVTKYYPDGSVQITENYKSGLLDGSRAVYTKELGAEAILRQDQQWKEGFPDGVFVKNDSKGNIIRKVQFSNGQFKGEI